VFKISRMTSNRLQIRSGGETRLCACASDLLAVKLTDIGNRVVEAIGGLRCRNTPHQICAGDRGEDST
jgi:hypothetical protein